MVGLARRVAVVVPAYNREDLLPHALESLVSQTYHDWEAVVVDDASRDGTYEVAREFERRHPDRVTTVRLDRNLGIGGARTTGVKASRGGELVCLLDSDDFMRDTYLEQSVAAYDAAVAGGRRIGIVSSNAAILTPEGMARETWFDRNGRIDPVDYDSMLRKNYLTVRALFSRAAFDEVGGEFARECRGSDDYDLWLRIMEAGYEAITVDEPLVVYRDHPGGDSKNVVSRADGAIECYRRALSRGALTRRQSRVVKRQMRHFRALRARSLVYQAVADRRLLKASSLAFRAAPTCLVAFAQDPSRWREWVADVLRPARG